MTKITLFIGAVAFIPILILILRRWERGMIYLLLYIPVSGVPILLSFYNPVAILFKDIAFVIPAYISFFCFFREKGSFKGIPKLFIMLLTTHILIVIIQMFNPSVPLLMVSLIGAKVWLFYIPLMLLTYFFASTRLQLLALLRPMVAIAWVPAAVGLFQWISSSMMGYEWTMRLFYGDAASAATQEFARFEFEGEWFRIPSTFSFAAQYSSYLWSALIACYVLMQIDVSHRWRQFAMYTLGLVIVASFLSGARGAYFFTPLITGLTFSLHKGFKGAFKIAGALLLLWVLVEYIGGFSVSAVFGNVHELLFYYGRVLAYEEFRSAASHSFFGMGTGMNTGATRYVAQSGGVDFFHYENYYGKVILELGIPGMLIFVSWQLSLIITAIHGTYNVQSSQLRGAFAALTAFFIVIALSNFKSFKMDIDPLNAYYWIFAGILFRLNSLLDSDSQATKNVHHPDRLNPKQTRPV